jgi:hypothetical protein
VSGAQTQCDAVKTPLVGGEKYSSCGKLSEGAVVESGGEVKAGVHDGVEDGIDVSV